MKNVRCIDKTKEKRVTYNFPQIEEKQCTYQLKNDMNLNKNV